MRLAKRIHQIQPFHVMELARRAGELQAEGRDIVRMDLGEPDFATPQPIVDAGIAALEQGRTRYTPATGLSVLREAIAAFYGNRYGIEVAPEQVIVTPGSSGALQLALALLVNPGEGVLMAAPGYPCNPNILRLVGGEPQFVEVTANTHYQLDAQLLEQHWQANSAAVLVASPSNPTGTLMPVAVLEEILGVIDAREGTLISDEIYHGLTFGCEAATALAFSDQAFVVNSFSKYFGMTGWRLGWLVAPAAMASSLEKMAQNLFIAASTIAQHAAMAAFDSATLEILEQRREVFRQRRDFLCQALPELGFTIDVKPEGAFYIYAGCEKFTDDSMRFCHDLLEKHGVSITPGIDFGSNYSATHVRFSYTTSMERLEEGVNRLARALP